MKNVVLNAAQHKKRLRGLLLLFFITLSLPVYYLLQTVYSQLENEAYFTARHQAEKLVDQIELNLLRLVETEQKRPIAEYQFFNVMENPLLSETAGVKFSPLSEIPPKTDIKGLIGYFQINTDGSFHIPALPELGQGNISGLSLSELESRVKLKNKIRHLLSIEQVEKKQRHTAEHSHEQDRAYSGISKPSYIEEFKQHSVDKIERALSTPVSESRLSTQSKISKAEKKQKAQRENSSIAKKYITRKETVQLPDQAMASSYFNQYKEQSAPIQGDQESITIEKQKLNQGEEKAIADTSAINVLSFESEVTPLQLIFIGKDYFCFYRYVWHDNNRYTQGFIVRRNEFLTAITQPLVSTPDFSSLVFSSHNSVQKISMLDTAFEYSLYQRNLSTPFQGIELKVNAVKKREVPGVFLVDLLALSIYLILLLGLIIFYRLVIKQIALAKQQQDFISAVSHELKTPLTSIRMYAEMLRSDWVIDSSKKHNYYDFIFFESERLSRLIANVLQLARLGNHNQSTEISTIVAEELLQRIAGKVSAQIEASHFQLKLLPANNKQIEVKVDEDACFQIFINLVDNAIKFSDKSSLKQIDIGFRLSEDYKTVIFFIRDYGVGIKKNQMKKIFQLFYRSEDELTRTTQGTGIGLALVAQLAETMQTKISVVNKKPGTEFRLVCSNAMVRHSFS